MSVETDLRIDGGRLQGRIDFCPPSKHTAPQVQDPLVPGLYQKPSSPFAS